MTATVAQVTAASPRPIIVLMVDDQAMVGEAMRRMLAPEADIAFHFCSDPTKAMQAARDLQPTVILQDLVMPQIDGLQLVKFFRANPATRDVPMIVLSSREEPETKYQAFQLGANDYLVKFPDKLEVVARIRYHSQAYLARRERDAALEALNAELREAERYMRALFPAPLTDAQVRADWLYISCTALGGDSFGYHWIDDDHFAVFVLDVCGHGVGAALLSASAVNVLRARSLPRVDFTDPSSVLAGLNEAFDMDKQNQMYFTIWYGVYRRSTRELVHASGGHPPAVLLPAAAPDAPRQLNSVNAIIGAMPGLEFKSQRMEIAPGDRLFVFSDGVYEVNYADRPEVMMTVEEFAAELARPAVKEVRKVDGMAAFVRRAQNRDQFDDDFSLVEIYFA
ncbi:MAG TPA: SpoIIE family protein phosphatase [Opitutales bacterium]|jgi:sigma-B regulation protein RsbU (phosphoserine phosphatase)|nr:SpoIIE family protein phosphatase [Opitutales bacterium]